MMFGKKGSRKKVKKPKRKAEKRAKPVKKDAKSRKGIMHKLWFSKKETNIYHHDTQKKPDKLEDIEKRINEIEPSVNKSVDKIGNIEETMGLLKDVIVELREENEHLRKEREALIDKLLESYPEKDVAAEKPLPVPSPNQQKTTKEVEEEEEDNYWGEEEPKNKKYVSTQGSQKKISTSLDSLLDMVNEKGSVKMQEAAKKLNVKDKKIEEWARMLEKNNLIKLHYPTVGKPILKKK